MKNLIVFILYFVSLTSSAQYMVIPDSTFGKDGILLIDELYQIHDDWYPKINSDSKGNIYLIGERYLIKILSNGMLDHSFGLNGAVPQYQEIWGTNVVIDKNDNVFVGGYDYKSATRYRSTVIKYFSNGKIDSTFAQHGLYQVADGNYLLDMFLVDDKILFSYIQKPNYSFAMQSILTSNGAIDTAFGNQGTLKSTVPNYLYDHVLFENNNSNFIYISLRSNYFNYLEFTKDGKIKSEVKTPHSLDLTYYNVFTATETNSGYLLGGVYNFEMIKILKEGIVDDSFGNGGIKQISNKYFGWFCESKKLNENLNVLAIQAYKDSLSCPAFLLLDKEGDLISNIGDSGIYLIKKVIDRNRNEAATIKVLNDSTFVIAGYYNYVKYFVAKYIVRELPVWVSTTKSEEIESFKIVDLYPNPFNGRAIVRFYSPHSEFVNFSIYDVLGKKVLESGYAAKSGENSISINMEQHVSGLYFLTIRSRNQIVQRKFTMMK